MFFLNFLSNRVSKSRAMRELQNLTDRELQDIGISRSEIPYLVMSGRHR